MVERNKYNTEGIEQMAIDSYSKYVNQCRMDSLNEIQYDHFFENEIYEYILDVIGYPVGMSFAFCCIRIPVKNPVRHTHIEHTDWNMNYIPRNYHTRISWYQEVLDRLQGNMMHIEREKKQI